MENQPAIQQAKQAIQVGDHPQALKILRQLLKQQPRNSQAWLLLSEVVDQPEHARQCLERVLQLDPGNAVARQRLSRYQGSPAQSSALITPPPAQASPTPASTTAPETEPEQPAVIPATPVQRPRRPGEAGQVRRPPARSGATQTQARQPDQRRRRPEQPNTTGKKPNRTTEYILLGVLVIVLCCVLGSTLAALGNSELLEPEPTTDSGDPREVLYENIRASNAENQAAYMATIHPDSPSYSITANSIGEAFSTHDLSYRLSNVEILSQDSRKAVVTFTLTTTRLRGPAFRDNRITGEMTMRLHEGQWKIYSQKVDEVEYLD